MAEENKKAFLDGTGLKSVWQKICNKFVSLDITNKVPSEQLPIASDIKLGAVKKGDNIEIDDQGTISSPDVSVTANGSNTGYVSSIIANGHGITVTKTALPENPDISIVNSNSGDFISGIEATDHTITVTKGTLPEIPDVSIINSGESAGYVSNITADGHNITVTKTALPAIPEIPDVSVTTSGTGYVSNIVENGHGITVTKTALPGINVNGNDTEGDFISSILAADHTITVTKGTLPEIPDVSITNNGESTGYVSSITADGHNINVTKTALPKVQVKTTGSGNGIASISATGNDHIVNAVMGNFVSLDESGKIPSSQLPSYVDDVIEATSFEALPPTGEAGKIYVTTDTNKTYRWGTSQYVEISESLALGNKQDTAFRGDYGQTAYNHATNADATSITGGTYGFYKVQVNSMGHVIGVQNVEKTDITSLGIPGSMPTVPTFEVEGETLVIG